MYKISKLKFVISKLSYLYKYDILDKDFCYTLFGKRIIHAWNIITIINQKLYIREL